MDTPLFYKARNATITIEQSEAASELRSCVKVEVDVLGRSRP